MFNVISSCEVRYATDTAQTGGVFGFGLRSALCLFCQVKLWILKFDFFKHKLKSFQSET